MAIKIFIPITVEIEDKSFKIEVRDETVADMEEIDKVSADADAVKDRLMKIYGELGEVEEQMRINDGILEGEENILERGKLWLEQRTLSKTKKRLKEELKSNPLEIDYRDAFKKRFEILVKGDDKVALEEEMKKYNIPYKRIIDEIDELKKALKKKK